MFFTHQSNGQLLIFDKRLKWYCYNEQIALGNFLGGFSVMIVLAKCLFVCISPDKM